MDSSQTSKTPSKPSLFSKDAATSTQLTSHALPGDDQPLVSACILSLVLASMVLGPLLTLCIPLLLVLGYIRVAATLGVVLATTMFVAGYSPTWCVMYMKVASWFTKGVHLHFEERAVVAFGQYPSLWCLHPHGTAVGLGFTLNGAIRFRTLQPTKFVPPAVDAVLMPHRQASCSGVMAPVLFTIPLLRNVLLGFGCCTPATKAGMTSLMRQGLDFGILPGGMEEVALYAYQRERIYIQHRAGFVKYALQYGYLLLPGYTFGECDLYQSMTRGASIRLWMQKHLGFIVPIFWGPYWAWWLPNRNVALHTVIGSPLKLPKIQNPSPQDVKHWHAQYMEAMQTLFDTHKEKFGYGDRKLEMM